MWLHASFIENMDLNPVEYGYIQDGDDHIITIVVTDILIPSDFPSPCTCVKCSKPKCVQMSRKTDSMLQVL